MSTPSQCEEANSNTDKLLIDPLIPKSQPETTKPKQRQGKPYHDVDEKDQYQGKAHIGLAIEEARSIARIALPMVLTGLLLYCRSMISMLFLGHLGDLSLAGGSVAIGFANITGYSILSGLAMGMEPLCGQAFGAKRYKLLGLTLQRTVLLLLLTSIPVSFLWLNMKKILIFCGQDEDIATEAQSYILYSLPDLITQSFLHPIRVYLRTQSITLPLTFCAAASILLHIPITYLLVSYLGLGIKGVAFSAVWTNFNLIAALTLYIFHSNIHATTCPKLSINCMTGWRTLTSLAIPSSISVCLEWWWYEIMILLSGMLLNPTATVSATGILIQTTSHIYIFPSSLSSSVSARVSNLLGASIPSQARLSALVSLSISFIIGLSALFLCFVFRHTWPALFTHDDHIVALTSTVLPIIGLCEMGNGPQTAMCGVVRGTARPKVEAKVNVWCFYFVGMPVGVWLGLKCGFGFEGLWFGLLAAQAACAVCMVVVLWWTDWEVEAMRAKALIESSNGSNEEDDDLLV